MNYDELRWITAERMNDETVENISIWISVNLFSSEHQPQRGSADAKQRVQLNKSSHSLTGTL